MGAPMAGVASAALDAVSLSATWSDIPLTAPTTQGTNEDRTLTWSLGGARNVSVSTSGAAVISALEYRINSGAWTAYGAAFSLTSGQTLGWRTNTAGVNGTETVTVTDASRAATIDTYDVVGSGH